MENVGAAPHRDAAIPDGPYLGSALLCDRVLVEANGTISIIRAIDRVTIVVPPDLPVPVYPFTGTLVVGLRGAPAGADDILLVVCRDPNGHELFRTEYYLEYGGALAGTNVSAELSLVLPMPGVYTFDVQLNGRFLSRVFLEVVRQEATPDEIPDEESHSSSPPPSRREGHRDGRS